MKKTLIILAIIFAAIFALYLLLGVFFYFFQKHIVFIPSHRNDPAPGDLNIKEVYFPTADNQMLHGWWMPVDSSEYTVLFLHGNGGCLGYCGERMHFFRELGYSTFAVDYRGYGKSTGRLNTEEDIYTDGRNAFKYVTDSLKIPMDKIIVWGWSLGGGVAVEIAQNLRLKAMVLEGTFYSLDDVSRYRYPFFPTKGFLKFHFCSGEKMGNIKAPVFFFHSSQDKSIPYEQGKKLFQTFTGTKEFLEISGSHNHGYYENRYKIIPALRKFLE